MIEALYAILRLNFVPTWHQLPDKDTSPNGVAGEPTPFKKIETLGEPDEERSEAPRMPA